MTILSNDYVNNFSSLIYDQNIKICLCNVLKYNIYNAYIYFNNIYIYFMILYNNR